MDAPEDPDASAASRPDRRTAAGPLLILGAVAVLFGRIFLNGSLADWGGDNVQYLLLAEGLVTGAGYVDLHLPTLPFHAHYPPLFPVLLAPFVAAGASLLVIKLWTALLSLAGLAVAFVFLVPVCGRGVSLLCVLATLCSAIFLDVSLSGMSDGPYLLISFAALLAMRRAFADISTGPGVASVAGLLTGAAILTRMIGLVLIPTAGLYLLLTTLVERRRGESGKAGKTKRPGRPRTRRLLLYGLALAVTTGPWFAAVIEHRGLARIGYLREFTGSGARPVPPRADLLERPPINALDLGARLIDTPLPAAVRALGAPWEDAARVAYVLLLMLACGIAALGFVRALAVRQGIEDIYAACYLVVLAFWLPGGFRLLVPLLPVLMLYLHDGARVVATRLGAKWIDPGRVGASALALVVAANLVVVFSFPRVERRLSGEYARWWNDYLRTVCTVGVLARPGDKVFARPANVPFYLTGVRAAPLRPSSREDLAEAIIASGARFVVLTPGLRGALGPELAEQVRRDPRRFAIVARSGVVEAYRLLSKEPASGPESAMPEPAATDPSRWSPRCRAVLPQAKR